MKITINDNWEIRTDAYNYILCHMGKAQTGKHAGELVSQREHFFPTLGQALGFAREKQILTSEGQSWAEVLDIVMGLQDDILDAIKTAGIDNCAVSST